MKISPKELKIILISKFFWIFVVFIAVFPFVYEMLPIRIEIALDKSLPYTFFLSREFREGDRFIEFAPPVKNEYTAGVKHLIKAIACSGGSTLHTRGLEYYCDGKYLGKAKTTDKHGKEIDHFVYNGVIPQEAFFVMGTHERSYDSRYFGFIWKEDIERGIEPLW